MSPTGSRAQLATRTPTGRDMLQWRRGSDVQTLDVDSKLVEIPIIEADLVREGAQWKNRPNRHGLYFWPSTGSHIWYESALEASCLMCLDQSGELASLTSQPFRLLFRTEAAQDFHDPDFFAVHRNGDQVVYDVKPRNRMTSQVRQQFEETARVCAAVGWRHVVLNEPNPVLVMNLGFLGPARHARFHPSEEALMQICQVFAGGRTVADGRSMINRRHPALAMPYIRHLLWHRILLADLTSRLDSDTVVTSATTSEELTCCA